jgi:hypothetical protein
MSASRLDGGKDLGPVLSDLVAAVEGTRRMYGRFVDEVCCKAPSHCVEVVTVDRVAKAIGKCQAG